MKTAKRNDRIAPMQLMARDVSVIFSVYENRFLRRDQIQRLHFAGSSLQATSDRLKKLSDHKLLEKLQRPVAVGASQAVYALDKRGADLLQLPWRSTGAKSDGNETITAWNGCSWSIPSEFQSSGYVSTWRLLRDKKKSFSTSAAKDRISGGSQFRVQRRSILLWLPMPSLAYRAPGANTSSFWKWTWGQKRFRGLLKRLLLTNGTGNPGNTERSMDLITFAS